MACLITADRALIFSFNIYYSWIEEIKMAEGKEYIFIVWVKSGLGSR